MSAARYARKRRNMERRARRDLERALERTGVLWAFYVAHGAPAHAEVAHARMQGILNALEALEGVPHVA